MCSFLLMESQICKVVLRYSLSGWNLLFRLYSPWTVIGVLFGLFRIHWSLALPILITHHPLTYFMCYLFHHQLAYSLLLLIDYLRQSPQLAICPHLYFTLISWYLCTVDPSTSLIPPSLYSSPFSWLLPLIQVLRYHFNSSIRLYLYRDLWLL